MYFSKSLQGSKSAITMRPVSIEPALLLFVIIKKILLDRRYDEPLFIYSRFVGMTV